MSATVIVGVNDDVLFSGNIIITRQEFEVLGTPLSVDALEVLVRAKTENLHSSMMELVLERMKG